MRRVKNKATDFWERDEIRALTEPSDLQGALAVVGTWAVIAGCFAAIAWVPHPVVWLVAVGLLGGRQLALAVLHHEASHHTLFKTRWLNEQVGDWLCSRPIWQDLARYRAHHRRHHARTGTRDDPDLSLVSGFPTTPASMARKLIRDISGLTGLKTVLGLALMDAERIEYTVAADITWLPRGSLGFHLAAFARNAWRPVLANLALLALLALAGHPELYLAWVAAFLSPFPLFVRIRSIAEHGCLPRVPDMLQNTRTTRAGWLARATVAPHGVNWHREHHLLPTVPWFRLPALNRRLVERGVPSEAPTYLDVLREAASATR